MFKRTYSFVVNIKDECQDLACTKESDLLESIGREN